jgi:hypothetical protein
MGQHCGQLSNKVLEIMDIDGLAGLERYMTVGESKSSGKNGFIDWLREWFKDK